MPDVDTEPKYPSDLVAKLAAAIHSDGFPSGERARLKRMGPGGSTPVSYYRFVNRYVPEEMRPPWLDSAWKTLISGLAQQHGNPHNSGISFGQALADTAYSEARLESLLAAEGRVLETLVSRASRRLAASRKTCNWKHLANLLFAANDDFRERVNRQIANDYFRASSAGAK